MSGLRPEIYKKLGWLNELSTEAAEAAFLTVCGSTEWSRRMAAARPFRLLTYLYEAGEEIWFSLSVADHLEAFAAHRSAGEQSHRAAALDDSVHVLADVIHLYEKKFGFIFVISETGKTVEEVVAICRARLGNSAETELKLAAIEQWKITEARLNELLES